MQTASRRGYSLQVIAWSSAFYEECGLLIAIGAVPLENLLVQLPGPLSSQVFVEWGYITTDAIQTKRIRVLNVRS